MFSETDAAWQKTWQEDLKSFSYSGRMGSHNTVHPENLSMPEKLCENIFYQVRKLHRRDKFDTFRLIHSCYFSWKFNFRYNRSGIIVINFKARLCMLPDDENQVSFDENLEDECCNKVLIRTVCWNIIAASYTREQMGYGARANFMGNLHSILFPRR